ncbi:MAG: PKD domain-containing protein, partial [Desulfobacterota bacterium]|nr:PKD domain-containing protein [Thermodesulfobacteriota bacterium]
MSFTATPNRIYQNMTYSWDFGDRTTGSGREVSHTYINPGTYTAQVTCRSTYYSATASIRIRVTPAGREVISFDCLAIEADTMSCSDNGDRCIMSGNVVINDLIAVGGSVTIDNTRNQITGSGDLTITTNSGDEEVLSTGPFTIQADVLDDDHDCCARLETDETFFWNLYGFQFDYEGMRIYDDHVEIPGKLRISFLVGSLQLEVTVIYSKRGRDLSGRLELPDIELSGFELSDCYLDLDTFAGQIEGGATLKVPGLNFEIGSEIGFYYGVLNMVKVEIGDLNKPILYSPPPTPAPIIFLQSISGGLENIAPQSPDPVVLTAGASVSGGPKVELPSINLLSGTLKVGGGEYEMLGADIDLEIDTGGRFTAEGTGYLLNDDFGTFGELVLILDIQRGVYFEGKLYYPPGEDFAMLIVTGAGKIDFGLNFQAALQGTLKAPNILWLIGGMTFGDAKAYIDNELISAGVQFGDRICVPFLGCADLTIKASVTFVFETGELSVARNWDNIGEVTFSYGKLMNMSGMAAAASGTSQTFTIDEDESAVIFRLEASGADASFILEAPDKTLYTPTSGNAFWRTNATIGEVWCAVPNPQKGKWTVTVSGTAKRYTCQLLRQNAEPQVSITTPDQDMTISAGQPITVKWHGDDADDNARVSLFYDEDRQGGNGALICNDMPVSGSYTWNTSSVPPGRYYLYAKITDGKNTPVIAYSRAAVTVRSTGLPAPVIKSVAQGPDGLSLLWDAVDGAAGYRVYYGPTRNSTPLQQCPAIAVWGETGAALHDLMWGKSYRIAVSAFDRDGREGDLSETVVVTMENRSGNNAPVITSQPVTVVQAANPFTYQIAAYDADRNPITYSILEGPAAMSVSSRGLVSWTPQDSDTGSHRIIIRATDSEGAYDEQQFDLSVLSSVQNIADPSVVIECSTTAGPAPLTVAFAAKTHDITSEQLAFSWDFGDGTTSSEEKPTHVFQDRGVYTVILTATTQSGRTASASVIINATGEVPTVAPPEVNLTVRGSQVWISLTPSASVQGNRMYVGRGVGNGIDYEHPVDIGEKNEIVFANVPAGLYSVVFRSYLAESGETWDSKKHFFAVPYAPKRTVDLPTGILEGRVFDAQTLQPIPNAQVGFVFYQTRTDERGAFRFEGLPDIKRAYAIADAKGYRTASEAVAIQQGLTTTCRILLWQGEDNQTCPAATYLPEHADKLRTFRD